MTEQTCHMITFHWEFLWVAYNNLKSSRNQVCDNRKCEIFKWGIRTQMSIFVQVWDFEKNICTRTDFVLLIVSLLVSDCWLTDTLFCRVLHWQPSRRSAAGCLWALASSSETRQTMRQAAAEKPTNARFVLANKSLGFWNSAWYSGPSPLHQLHITGLRTSQNTLWKKNSLGAHSMQDQHMQFRMTLFQSLQQQQASQSEYLQWSWSSPK